jgi:hypothetical protein
VEGDIVTTAFTASSQQSLCMLLARRLTLAERHQRPHMELQVASHFFMISRCDFSSRLTELAYQPFLFWTMVARPGQRVVCSRSAAVLNAASTHYCASKRRSRPLVYLRPLVGVGLFGRPIVRMSIYVLGFHVAPPLTVDDTFRLSSP